MGRRNLGLRVLPALESQNPASCEITGSPHPHSQEGGGLCVWPCPVPPDLPAQPPRCLLQQLAACPTSTCPTPPGASLTAVGRGPYAKPTCRASTSSCSIPSVPTLHTQMPCPSWASPAFPPPRSAPATLNLRSTEALDLAGPSPAPPSLLSPGKVLRLQRTVPSPLQSARPSGQQGAIPSSSAASALCANSQWGNHQPCPGE